LFLSERGKDFKKNELKPWLKKEWKIPRGSKEEFVWRMEAILDIYKRVYNPLNPVVCFDESSKQQIQDLVDALPPRPGDVAKFDSEYQRNGVSNLFMIFEPLQGKRYVKVTDRRTKMDWAECMKFIVDEMYPNALRVTIVMDNLNTHSPASLYVRFDPATAKRIADKLDIQYTPKHGSWLNMAEIEFSALSRQCLNRRIASQKKLTEEVAIWEAARNAATVRCDWQFTTFDARIKLRKLYPTMDQKLI
jgi:DDE superfamily endonuclease